MLKKTKLNIALFIIGFSWGFHAYLIEGLSIDTLIFAMILMIACNVIGYIQGVDSVTKTSKDS